MGARRKWITLYTFDFSVESPGSNYVHLLNFDRLNGDPRSGLFSIDLNAGTTEEYLTFIL